MRGYSVRSGVGATLVALAALIAAGSVCAQLTDISPVPIPTAAPVMTRPNLMYILDDSGSMGWEHMPDHIDDVANCRDVSNSHTQSCSSAPPFFTPRVNGVYYNPAVTYFPPATATGGSFANSDPSAASSDGFASGSGSRDLTSRYREPVWCDRGGNCKRNGVDTTGGATFNYHTDGFPRVVSGTRYDDLTWRNGSPFYFDITPREYCTDSNLTTCSLQSTPSGAFVVPAYVRYCGSAVDAASNSAVTTPTGSTPLCQARFIEGRYTMMRLGLLKRVDIVPTVSTYPGSSGRSDCVARPTCSYGEELQNFANWYTYYRNRINTMKSVTGRVFARLDDKIRVGLVTINASGGNGDRYVPIGNFDAAKKAAWYDKLYSIPADGWTPLREALSVVGRHYAGITSGVNGFMPHDPVQNSCQRNYALLTTDGYWNGETSYDLNGNPVGNQDNVNSGDSARSLGVFDGGTSGASDTLADVAYYYYKTDLRPGMNNDVPTSTRDTAKWQHMTTFTLGLGVDGFLKYEADYLNSTTGDFEKIRTEARGCVWTVDGSCNWPAPSGSAKVDDLWHAAVNGRGLYFSASDPTTLMTMLTTALNEINNEAKAGSASAATTSSPSITLRDNFIFDATHRTFAWTGDLTARTIDTTTGAVSATPLWSAATQLASRTTADTDTRRIYTYDSATASRLKEFQHNNLSASEKNWFDQMCGATPRLPQCADFTGNQIAFANNGNNLVNFLRGQRLTEIAPRVLDRDNNDVFRKREGILGDISGSSPAFVGRPTQAYADATATPYSTFVSSNSSRRGVVYVGANDGMLHAFASDTGEELWAYVPRMVMPDMYVLASTDYSLTHRFLVDGSPTVMDAWVGGAWRTILVGGLNAGGRGFYALDVTDPTAPRALWEICADASRCGIVETDLGLSYGNPVITKRASDGRWVVLLTSGYNNVSPGTGQGYLFVLDLLTGSLLSKISTSTGSTTTPSGFARIIAYADNARTDNTTKFVYGGDLQGNVWRFDLTTATPTVMKLGEARDASGKVQAITTLPEITRMSDGTRVLFVGTGRLLGPSDRQDPATLTPAGTWSQQNSVYAFKDRGTNLGSLRGVTANLVQQTLTASSATSRSGSNNPVDWRTRNGWYVDFNPGGTSAGERVNIDPQLARGTLIVVTNVPTGSECSEPKGTGWVYQFDYSSGAPVPNADGSMPPVGTKYGTQTMLGGATVFQLPNGSITGWTQDGNGLGTSTGTTYGKEFPINTRGSSTTGRRLAWREIYR